MDVMLANKPDPQDDHKCSRDDVSIAIRKVGECNSFYLDANEDADNSFSNIDIDENSFFIAKDNQDLRCKDTINYIKIHELRHYKVSCDYKCDKDCSFQFYIKCFDTNLTEIETFHVARVGAPVIVKGIDNDKKTIKCEGDLSQWTQVNENTLCSDRIIGFNYKGENVYDKVVADDYIKYNGSWRDNGKTKGGYCDIDNKEKIIKLSVAIPNDIKKKIINNETVIRNHLWGSTSTYLSMFDSTNVVTDGKWHHCQRVIGGVDTMFLSDKRRENNNKFRKGTKYIKLGIRRYGKSTGCMWFNHVKFEQVDIN